MKCVVSGAVLAALCGGAAQAAARPVVAPWVIQPADAACRADLELAGHSGAVTPVTLISDGETLTLRFAKDGLPERAFLPIRIDRTPYSNLMRRTADPAVGELTLSESTRAAMRKGVTLSIAWLGDEPVSAPLAGSERGVPDLITCGAQVAGEAHARLAAERTAAERAEAEARERALAEAQLKAAEAQVAAAEAQRQRQAEAAERERAEARRAQIEIADRQRLAYQAQEERADEAQREESYEEQRQRAYEEAQRRYQLEPQQLALPPAPQPYFPPGRAWGRRW